MKKTTITILAVLMAVSFVCLLTMQVHYIKEVIELRQLHFEESVARSLNETVHQLEISEATRYLEQGIGLMPNTYNMDQNDVQEDVAADSTTIQGTGNLLPKDGAVFVYNESSSNANFSDKYFTKRSNGINDKSRTLQEIMLERYENQKELI